jgi:hypothetical protein
MKRKEAHSKMSIRGNQSTKEHISGQMDAREKSLLCVELARRRRAKDVVVLDLKGLVAFTDYFVICTGRFLAVSRASPKVNGFLWITMM